MKNSSQGKEELGQGGESPTAALNAEHERFKAELSREHGLYLRTLADFDNYRRRVERERAASAQAGKRELVMPLLEVMADFDRAFEHLVDAPEWVSSGFVAIYRSLNSILQAQDIVPFESLGDRFDPLKHEAIGVTESTDVDSGTVVAQLSRGYRWGNEVLRPARVRVAQ
jgi:molecular chaperone GrpE